MKIALIGSRDFNNYSLFCEELKRICEKNEWVITEIVSGGAAGADRLAWMYAKTKKIKYKEFPADWKTYGKIAGHMRNTDIVNYSDAVIAFWDMKSNGTRDSIEKTKLQAKPLEIINISTSGTTA